MRYPYAVIIFSIIFLIQSTVLDYISIFGYAPNLLLCLVVVFAFLYKEKYALSLGIIFGLLLDLTCAQYVGISSIAFTAVYFLISLLKVTLNQEQLIPDLLMSLMGTVVYSFCYWAIYAIMGSPYTLVFMLRSIPVLLVYNLIFVLIFHLIFVRGVIKHRTDKKFEGNIDVVKGYRNI